jgi:hypothetical protein
MTSYNTSKPLAGDIKPKQLTCDIDEYYVGMPLAYSEAISDVACVGDGNGTCTLISADKSAAVGSHVITFSAALVAEIVGPDGKREELAVADGAAKAFVINGLSFTITDGLTAFSAADVFTIAVAGDGAYGYNITKPEVIAWEETEKVAEGDVLCAISGSEILHSGLLEDDGATELTLTDDAVAHLLLNGVILR